MCISMTIIFNYKNVVYVYYTESQRWSVIVLDEIRVVSKLNVFTSPVGAFISVHLCQGNKY